jgi:hypothetical protein
MADDRRAERGKTEVPAKRIFGDLRQKIALARIFFA